jgi:EmrB/QacA subfamily drug resistance transporter
MALLRPATHRGLHLIPETRHPRRLPTLVAMAAAAGIGQFPTSAIAVALPTVHQELDASLSELQWMITAFTLAMSAFLIASGRLADTFGRRRVLLAGTAVFAGGSVVAALAGTAGMLIAGTAVAGIGVAAMTPSSLSIVVSSYPPERRGLPIGVWGASTALAQAFGPLIGGALTGGPGWQWIFWLNVAVAGAVIAVALWATAETRDPDAEPHIDTAGLGLAAAGLLTLTLPIIQAPTWGWGAPQTIILLAVAVALVLAFGLVERRSSAPLVDFGFFRRRNFSGATTVLFVLNFALIVALFFLPLYLQEQLGFSATEAGVRLLPLMGMLIVMLPLGGPVAERIGALPPIAVGVGVTALSLFVLAGAGVDTSYGDVWLPMALVGGGTGLALTPMNLAAMNAIPTRHSGSAGGVFTTLSGIGIAFGVAVTGAVFNSLQLSQTQSLAADRGIQVSAQQAQGLDGLLAGAPGARSTLAEFPHRTQEALEHVVREAFMHALGGAFRVGGFVALGGLLLALALIRRRPPADELEARQEAGAPGGAPSTDPATPPA